MSDDRDARVSPAGSTDEPGEHGSPAGCLVRLAWLLFGPAALFLGAAMIADGRGPHHFGTDLALFGVAAAMVALRYLDIARLEGQRANGGRATMDDFRRYAGLVAVVALMLWGGATWLRG